mmetsp:Transcript_6432/g.13494  ORF Transcript_6432/g.13494 Transcript_6432/m.13494 type:complete len:218 (+) Transcript_6432:746-1399(+)
MHAPNVIEYLRDIRMVESISGRSGVHGLRQHLEGLLPPVQSCEGCGPLRKTVGEERVIWPRASPAQRYCLLECFEGIGVVLRSHLDDTDVVQGRSEEAARGVGDGVFGRGGCAIENGFLSGGEGLKIGEGLQIPPTFVDDCLEEGKGLAVFFLLDKKHDVSMVHFPKLLHFVLYRHGIVRFLCDDVRGPFLLLLRGRRGWRGRRRIFPILALHHWCR